MRAVYTALMAVFAGALRLASLWNAKARKAVSGRSTQRKQDLDFSAMHGCVWFHCASLGEFEQARPVIEAIRKDQPDTPLLLTFFSPSGYEVRKDYALADAVVYLPLDLPGRMAAFLDRYRPAQAFVVKYEVWPNLFAALEQRGIPVVLFSAIFRPDHRYFQWYGGLFRKALHSCRHIFVQNAQSVELLQSIGLEQVSLVGDTRFDRVSDVAANASRIPMVESFLDGAWTLIAGSSWPKDEQWLSALWAMAPEGWKLIIAPHEVHDTHISSIEQVFPGAVRYSNLSLGSAAGSNVLIIDNIGMLTQLYQYGHVALIGGGFGKGIHNVLEAAVFGMPVAFGPNHKKFQEALDLLAAGGAHALTSPGEVPGEVIAWLNDPHVRAEAGRNAREYVRAGTGATAEIRATLAAE